MSQINDGKTARDKPDGKADPVDKLTEWLYESNHRKREQAKLRKLETKEGQKAFYEETNKIISSLKLELQKKTIEAELAEKA